MAASARFSPTCTGMIRTKAVTNKEQKRKMPLAEEISTEVTHRSASFFFPFTCYQKIPTCIKTGMKTERWFN